MLHALTQQPSSPSTYCGLRRSCSLIALFYFFAGILAREYIYRLLLLIFEFFFDPVPRLPLS